MIIVPVSVGVLAYFDLFIFENTSIGTISVAITLKGSESALQVVFEAVRNIVVNLLASLTDL
jgi:hypothetical protein